MYYYILNAEITIEGINDSSIFTDNNGEAIIKLTSGEYNYTVTHDVYKTVTDTFQIDNEDIETVIMREKDEEEITVGKTETLTATIEPENATNKSVTWSSSYKSVATASDGLVTAISPGEATITVTTEDGGKTATCEVTVKSKAPAKEASLESIESYGMHEGVIYEGYRLKDN